MHPYTPFITEELWSFFKSRTANDLIVSFWPSEDMSLINDKIEDEMSILQDLISSIRAIRSRINISPSKNIDIKIKGNQNQKDFINQNSNLIISLAKLNSYNEML